MPKYITAVSSSSEDSIIFSQKTIGYRIAKFFLLSPYYAIVAAISAIAAGATATVAVVDSFTDHHSPLLFFSDEDSMTTQSPLFSIPSPAIPSALTTARIDYIAHVYVMPVLLVIGFINQCLNIWTLNTMRAAAYLYLKGSAIADILSIFALIPFCLRHGGFSDEHSQFIMFYHAHLELPIINSLITASALCLVVMTVDRYLSIRYPIVFHNSSGARSRIRNTVFLLYFIAFLVFLPSGIQKRLIGVPDPEDVYNRTRWRVERNASINRSIGFVIYLYFREVRFCRLLNGYSIPVLFQTIARIGPIIILVVLNLGMIRSLQQIDDTRRARASATSAAVPTVARQLRVTQDRRRILILLFITSATFVLCTLPASALSFFIDHSHRSVELQIFRAFANCLQVSQ